MDDVAQLARRVVANLFTPLPGAGAVAPNLEADWDSLFTSLSSSLHLGDNELRHPQKLQDVAVCPATSFFCDARVSVYYRSIRTFTSVSVFTKTMKRFPSGSTAFSPRLNPLIKTTGAIGQSNVPKTIIRVATSPL